MADEESPPDGPETNPPTNDRAAETRREFLRGWVKAHSETFLHYRGALDRLIRDDPRARGAAFHQGQIRAHATWALRFRAELEQDEVLAYAADHLEGAATRGRPASHRTVAELEAIRAWDAYAYLGHEGVLPKREGRPRADHAKVAADRLGMPLANFQKARNTVQPNPLRAIWKDKLERHPKEERLALIEEWAEKEGVRFQRLKSYGT